MTVEKCHVVLLTGEVADQARQFAEAAELAFRRAQKALPGDRSDIVRFEELSGAVEVVAAHGWSAGAKAVPAESQEGVTFPWGTHLQANDPTVQTGEPIGDAPASASFCVQLRTPFSPGPTIRSRTDVQREPAEPFRGTAHGRVAAVSERMDLQCDAVLAGKPGAVINPSGVDNPVLTDALRRACGKKPGVKAIDAPIVYRDGSIGPTFPFSAVALRDEPIKHRRELRFALLSIRHPDLDIEVHGCWLRNTVVSRGRPAGETDRLVHQLSRQQLDELLAAGPVSIIMYQTGLDSAIVGFYRAVAEVLCERPGTLSVFPRYWRRGSSFQDGAPWST